jgi:hypothetical protein
MLGLLGFILYLLLLMVVSIKSAQYSIINVLISFSALVFSVMTAFKHEIFPFNLNLLADEIILAPPTLQSHNSLAIIFPLVFINNGNGSAVVEQLFIKIKEKNSIKIYTPIVEIDFRKFLTGSRKLHAESLIGSFMQFPMGGKESIQKYILFSQEENSAIYPFNNWTKGSYTFEIYVKNTSQKNPVLYVKFKHFISEKCLNEYEQGNCISLSSSHEIII